MPNACCGYIPAIANCVTDVASTFEWPSSCNSRQVARRRKVFRRNALSQYFHLQGKCVADATFRLNDAWHARLTLEFAAQPENLNIDAAIEDVFVHARGLKQILARQRALRRFEESDEQGIFTFGERYLSAGRIGERAETAIEKPATETIASALRLPLAAAAYALMPAHDGADARKKFAQAEGFRYVVVGAEFQADDAIDFVAPMACHNDHGNIGTRPNFAQKVEPVLLAELQIEDDQVWLFSRKLPQHRLASAGNDDAHIVASQVVLDEIADAQIVVDKQNPQRTAGVRLRRRFA
jgi:hypothetical protein